MRIVGEFDEMLRMRNLRYLADTFNMIGTLGDRLLEGLHFEDYRNRLNAALSNSATPEEREELLAELHDVYSREASRLQQRLEVLRFLSQEVQERLLRPDFQALTIAPGELPFPEERRSLPHPGASEWIRTSDLATQIEPRSDQNGSFDTNDS